MTLILVLIGFCLGLLANQLKIDLIANRELVMLPIYYSGFWIGKKCVISVSCKHFYL